MKVEAQVDIRASRAATWARIADIEHAATFTKGIEKIEILQRPARGLVGLKWRETRILFGKTASADKWITEAVVNESYRTRAEDGGFAFETTRRISGSDGAVTLSETHESLPQTFGARVMAIPMALFFRGTIRNASLQDLNDTKAGVEGGRATPA